MELTPSRVLPIILAVFAALALTYSFVTRLKWAPDEPAHFIYIRSLAVNHTTPPISHVDTPHEDSEATHEGHQPPLYYALMAVPFALLKGLGASNDTIWRVLRLLNIPIGLLWMCAVFTLAREYFGRDTPALAATALVALIPTAPYMAGVINNDALIALLFTAAMVPVLRLFRTGDLPICSAVWTGSLIGLASLAKAQGLILIPVLLVAALAACRRASYANWRAILRPTGIALGAAAVVSGWWFVRCWMLYGTPTPSSLNVPMLIGGVWELLVVPVGYAVVAWQLTEAAYTFFCVPYWIVGPFLQGPTVVTWVLAILTGTMIVGLVIRIRRGGVDTRSLAFLLLAPLLVWLAWLRYVLLVDKWANLQGRLFLAVAAVAGITWVLGFDGLLKTSRAKRVGAGVGYALMLAANAWVISCAVRLYG